MTPIVFLDIDGVLNDHTALPSGYCGICRERAGRLNVLLEKVPEAKLVISSAWRYLILRGDMTIRGFETLLLTHGLNCLGRVHGHTEADGPLEQEPSHFEVDVWHQLGLKYRREQILRYIQLHSIQQYVVLDDLPLDLPRFVQTHGKVGLTNEDLAHAIEIITK
jgi:hypothetical protein